MFLLNVEVVGEDVLPFVVVCELVGNLRLHGLALQSLVRLRSGVDALARIAEVSSEDALEGESLDRCEFEIQLRCDADSLDIVHVTAAHVVGKRIHVTVAQRIVHELSVVIVHLSERRHAEHAVPDAAVALVVVRIHGVEVESVFQDFVSLEVNLCACGIALHLVALEQSLLVIIADGEIGCHAVVAV